VSAVSKQEWADDVSAPEPLGADSLTWQYFGQWLGFAFCSVPQLLQLMHPVLGAAVEEHSNVNTDPFDRLIRSMGPIYGVIYDGPAAEQTAVAVRSYHEHIKGVLPSGERYSGLNPEVFHWAHATFVHGLIYGFSEVLGPFTREQQEQMYAESRQWYRLYGMTMRSVPETLDEFDEYWEHYVNDVLELTPAADWLLATFKAPPPPPGFGWMPAPLWWPLSRAGGHGAVILASGLLPAAAREKLDLPWGPAQQLQFRVFVRTLRTLVQITPARFRYHPRALGGWRREARERGVGVGKAIRTSAP
jgi:uncharacterized protein (DUF2236 family)